MQVAHGELLGIVHSCSAVVGGEICKRRHDYLEVPAFAQWVQETICVGFLNKPIAAAADKLQRPLVMFFRY